MKGYIKDLRDSFNILKEDVEYGKENDDYYERDRESVIKMIKNVEKWLILIEKRIEDGKM